MLIHWSYVIIVVGLGIFNWLQDTSAVFSPMARVSPFSPGSWKTEPRIAKMENANAAPIFAPQQRWFCRLFVRDVRKNMRKHVTQIAEKNNTREHQTISEEDQMHMCIIVDTEIATEKMIHILFTTLSFQLTDVGRMTPAMQKCCRRAQHRNNNKFSMNPCKAGYSLKESDPKM